MSTGEVKSSPVPRLFVLKISTIVMSIKNFLLYVSLVFTVAGCATSGDKFQKDSPAHTAEALLYIYRPPGFIGIGQSPDIKIDGQTVGSMVSGGFLVKKMTVGSHVLVLTGNASAHTWSFAERSGSVNFAASGNYYYRYAPAHYYRGSNTIVHTYTFVQVAEVEALQELANLNKIK
jgi:Protein of unknown function (DUF2846)